MKPTAFLPGSGFLLGLLAVCLFLVCSDVGYETGRDRGPGPDGWVRVTTPDRPGRFFRVMSGEPLSAFLERELPGREKRLSSSCSEIPVDSGLEIRLVESGPGSRELSCRVSPLDEACRVLLGRPMNLNRAGMEDLTLIPGIGPVLARRIVRARDGQGGFSALEQLLSVHGIGNGLLKTIGRHATVEP